MGCGVLAAFGDPLRTLSATRAALGRHVPDPVAAAIKSGAGEGLTQVSAARRARQSYCHAGGCGVPPPALANTRSAAATLCEGTGRIAEPPGARHRGQPQRHRSRHRQRGILARTLSDAGLTIVSGLALGIDTAHRGGLAGNASSVAVVGTGLDIVYPARNRASHTSWRSAACWFRSSSSARQPFPPIFRVATA